ncbi:MAG: hypothetical protein AVDCRST_MAG89-3654, partial [uncultured Gemmatimonadetes bacterium]
EAPDRTRTRSRHRRLREHRPADAAGTGRGAGPAGGHRGARHVRGHLLAAGPVAHHRAPHLGGRGRQAARRAGGDEPADDLAPRRRAQVPARHPGRRLGRVHRRERPRDRRHHAPARARDQRQARFL